MNAFSPSITHSPVASSSTALVRVPPASLPASGSVRPKPPSARPATRSGSQRLALLLGAEVEDRVGAEADAGLERDGHRLVDPGELLDGDAQRREVAAAAAVLLGERDAEQPELAHRQHGRRPGTCGRGPRPRRAARSRRSAKSRTTLRKRLLLVAQLSGPWSRIVDWRPWRPSDPWTREAAMIIDTDGARRRRRPAAAPTCVDVTDDLAALDSARLLGRRPAVRRAAGVRPLRAGPPGARPGPGRRGAARSPTRGRPRSTEPRSRRGVDADPRRRSPPATCTRST